MYIKTPKYLLLFVVALAITLFGPKANAQTDLLPYFNTDKAGVWVDGYDPVAYITEKKAVKGKKDIFFNYKGATFRFANIKDKDLFAAKPESYLPAYGGYCAYALGAKNEKVEVDPETFTVINGKVYLFYNKFFNNTLTDWKKDEANLNKKADANWAKFKHKNQ